MNSFDEQQNRAMPPQNPNKTQSDGLAIASLVLGILSILTILTLVFSYSFGILAIVFGILSLKSQKRNLAISGIVTGSIGLVLGIIITILSVAVVLFLNQEPKNLLLNPSNAPSVSLEQAKDDLKSLNRALFYGDGYELVYSNKLWVPTKISLIGIGENIESLGYIPDGTIFIPMNVKDMAGYSTSTKEELII